MFEPLDRGDEWDQNPKAPFTARGFNWTDESLAVVHMELQRQFDAYCGIEEGVFPASQDYELSCVAARKIFSFAHIFDFYLERNLGVTRQVSAPLVEETRRQVSSLFEAFDTKRDRFLVPIVGPLSQNQFSVFQFQRPSESFTGGAGAVLSYTALEGETPKVTPMFIGNSYQEALDSAREAGQSIRRRYREAGELVLTLPASCLCALVMSEVVKHEEELIAGAVGLVVPKSGEGEFLTGLLVYSGSAASMELREKVHSVMVGVHFGVPEIEWAGCEYARL